MKITIRMYRNHDMDLLTLYKNSNFGFLKATKAALKAAASGKIYQFWIPKSDKPLNNFNFKYVYQAFVYLDEKEDKDIIDWLSKVKKGYRNSLIKMVLRSSMIGPAYYACFADDNIRMICDDIYDTNYSKYEIAPKKKKDKMKKNNSKSHIIKDTQNNLKIDDNSNNSNNLNNQDEKKDNFTNSVVNNIITNGIINNNIKNDYSNKTENDIINNEDTYKAEKNNINTPAEDADNYDFFDSLQGLFDQF